MLMQLRNRVIYTSTQDGYPDKLIEQHVKAVSSENQAVYHAPLRK